MANFVNKIKRMGFFPQADENADYDDFDTDFEEESYDRDYSAFTESRTSSSHSSRVSSISGQEISATAKLKVILFKPINFGDETKTIATELNHKNTVVLNLENANGEVARRTLDFLGGVAFANNGNIKRIATKTFIILPQNINLTGDDLLDELERNDIYC
ncbi:MAG: cell division protein SepF [Clostridiales bacterium]|nr:cell division protein SepF [Clostridiales bacterium]